MMRFLRSTRLSYVLWALLLTFVVAFLYSRNTFSSGATTTTTRGSQSAASSTTAGDGTFSNNNNNEEALLESVSTNERFHKNSSNIPVGMPSWLGKYPFMPPADQVDDEDRMCYVHVGRTAGSTLACYLGFLYDLCPSGRVKIPSGNLPVVTTSMIHKEFNDCKDKVMSRYLFLVKNPLTRLQSWFGYERPDAAHPNRGRFKIFSRKEKLFTDCPFPTLDALGGPKGLGAHDSTVCSKRARKAITGEVGYMFHNQYNYEYYYDEIRSNTKGKDPPKIVAIRTEHLEQDWSSIEANILGGPRLPDDFKFAYAKHRTGKHPQDRKDFILSKQSRTNICRVLCREIQVYKRILAQAENLDESDYAVSMKELRASCPVEAKLTECPSE